MAKALFGHVGLAPDHLLISDMRRLHRRVAELEAEVARLRELNEELAAHLTVDDDMLMSVSSGEPAYT